MGFVMLNPTFSPKTSHLLIMFTKDKNKVRKLYSKIYLYSENKSLKHIQVGAKACKA